MKRSVTRIEPYLTRDYIDRAAKMRELQPVDVSVSNLDLVATWIVLAGVGILIWMNW